VAFNISKSSLDKAARLMQRYWGVTLWKNRPKFAEDHLPEMPEEEPQRIGRAPRPAGAVEAATLRGAGRRPKPSTN